MGSGSLASSSDRYGLPSLEFHLPDGAFSIRSHALEYSPSQVFEVVQLRLVSSSFGRLMLLAWHTSSELRAFLFYWCGTLLGIEFTPSRADIPVYSTPLCQEIKFRRKGH